MRPKLFKGIKSPRKAFNQGQLCPLHSQNSDDQLHSDNFKCEIIFSRTLRDMFVGIALAPSDETDTVDFFFFWIVGTFGLINLREQLV
jgi:hypothetical protein